VSNPAFPSDSLALSIRCEGYPQAGDIVIPIVALYKDLRPNTLGSTILLQDLDGNERQGETVFVEVSNPLSVGIVARTYILMDLEFFFVTSVSGTTLGCLRAQRGSNSAPHVTSGSGDRRNVDGTAGYFSTSVDTIVYVVDAGLGQGPNVVLDLVQKVQLPAGCEVFFDNLFTTFPLLDKLSEIGIAGAGTVRQNRLFKVPNAHRFQEGCYKEVSGKGFPGDTLQR